MASRTGTKAATSLTRINLAVLRILTVYPINETESKDENHVYKKYGKISFVDLASSERLKESMSEDSMTKDIGQINKSLYTLGKFISMISSKDSPLEINHNKSTYSTQN